MKSKKKDSCSIPPLRSEGVLIADAVGKANILNRQYSSVFTLEDTIVWRIWHITSFWDITDVFLHILVEYTLLMKNQLDATLGMLSIFCN